MLNEKQSPGNESDQSLKSITRDVVIPSLNSPGDFTDGSSDKKTMSNSSNSGQNNGPRDQSSQSPDQSGQSRDYSSQSRDQSTKSRDHLSESHSCQNPNARDAHAGNTHEARDTNTDGMNDKADVNMAKTENNNSRENNCQVRGSSRVSRTRDSVTRQPRDIGTCLNTLDYLKAVLQSTMVSP
jgi:hypothetical protein